MSMNPSEFFRKEQEEADDALRALLSELKPPGNIKPYCYQCGRMTAPTLGDPCPEKPCGLDPIG